MAVLWKGRRDNNRLSLMRDIAISTVIGVSVGLFALGAVNDRKVRLTNYKPVANWHIDNAYEETQVTDVVSAILADFRGTDTMLEITVFSMAALGVLTLLTIPQGRELLSLRRVTQVMREVTVDEGTEMPENTESMTMDEYGAFGDAHDVPRLATPITRVVATLVLPFAILISLSHVLYGGSGPGDGFTAGVVSGLAVALWYVVFGYFEARLRLRWLQPGRLIAVGLFIAVLNALLGMVFGEGFLNIYMLGDGRGPAGLHLVSPVIFEFAIFLTVFGGVTAIMEAIAHPDEVEVSL